MQPQAEAGEYRGIRFFRSPTQPELFYFLPSGPGPERDAQGRPTLILVNSQPRSSLQLGSRWEVEPSLLEDLRAHLGSLFNLNPNLIDLRPGQFQVDSVSLGLGNGDGPLQELQRSKSSNYAPLSAIFQANLDAEQSARAMSALTGHKGYLAVTWRGTLTVPGQEPRQVEQATDVSDWFPSASGLQHMIMAAAPAGAPAPEAAPVEVACGFDASGAPVAAVEIRSRTAATHLAPPQLAPARVSASVNERLHVKTSFTRPIAPYESDTEPVGGSRYSLRPADLGLSMVVVDANSRRLAGARSLQVRLKYTPRGDGAADETVLRFRYGEWTATWFVISRGPDLNGSLEYSATEVGADGSATNYPPLKTDDPNLQF